jgi:hypothetical protein
LVLVTIRVLWFMLVRFNNLKILLPAADAKPGGLIGAMLSPYLYSTNMNDFCKRFNEQTKVYNSNVYITVKLFCDISEKFYTFFLKGIPLICFYHYQFFLKRKMPIIFMYDLVLYFKKQYQINSLYSAAFICFSILKTRRRRRFLISFNLALKIKMKIFLKF